MASATIDTLSFTHIAVILGAFTVVYTALGGLKAVIMTDTVQWIILLIGLIGFGLPFAYLELGGWQVIRSALPDDMFI